MIYLKVHEVPKGPIGNEGSKRYLKLKELPKGPRGTHSGKRYP